jgi:hypothetical protein
MKMKQTKSENQARPEAKEPPKTDRGESLVLLVKEIRQKLESVSEIKKSIRRNEETKAEAAISLKLAASPGLTIAESRTKIIDARIQIDFCEGKDGTLYDEFAAARAELLEKTEKAADKFNSIVIEQREGVIADSGPGMLYAAQYQFSRICFDPSLHFMTARRAIGWSEEGVARLFLAHIKRHAEQIGINPETV